MLQPQVKLPTVLLQLPWLSQLWVFAVHSLASVRTTENNHECSDSDRGPTWSQRGSSSAPSPRFRSRPDSIIPVQVVPDPVYPALQPQMKLLCVLLQLAWVSQLWAPVVHSFTSARTDETK